MPRPGGAQLQYPLGGAALAAPSVCAVWRADAALRRSLPLTCALPGHLAVPQGVCAVVGLAHAKSRSGGLQRTRAFEGFVAEKPGVAPPRAEADGGSAPASEEPAVRVFRPQRCADFDCQPDRLPHADCLKVGQVGALAYCGLVAAGWRSPAAGVQRGVPGGEVAPEVALVDLQPLRGGGGVLAGSTAQLQMRDACTGKMRTLAPLPTANSGRWLLASDSIGRLACLHAATFPDQGSRACNAIEVRAVADLSVLRTIDLKDRSGLYASDTGRMSVGLGLWGGEAYVLDHSSEPVASAWRSSARLPRVLVFSASSGAHARSWDLSWACCSRHELLHSFREGLVLERLLSLCVGACGVYVLSLEHDSSASCSNDLEGSCTTNCSPSATLGEVFGRQFGQAALVLRLYTHQGEPLLTMDLAQVVPAAARGALWRCESASIGPALEGHGEGAEWLYVTGRRSTSAVLSADAVPHAQPQWDESSCAGFVWAFGFGFHA